MPWGKTQCCLGQAIWIFKSPLSPGDFQRMRVIFDPRLVLTKPSLSGSGRGCGTELCPRWATHHLRRYFTTCRFHHILFLTTSLPHQQYQWVIDLPLTRRASENNCYTWRLQSTPSPSLTKESNCCRQPLLFNFREQLLCWQQSTSSHPITSQLLPLFCGGYYKALGRSEKRRDGVKE